MRQKLQERFTVKKDDIKKLPLTESEALLEQDGTTYKCRGAYEIPVWRLDQKNLNERIYSSKLAEKLMKESAVTLGLANHPKDEADVLNTFAVEKNPHVREGIMYVDAYLVGKNGELANEILEAGGQIGLSSSAYGDVDDNGTVLEEGFEIERYADWVDQPSYQVFASKESKKEEKEEDKESAEKKVEEKVEEKKEKAMAENPTKEKKLTLAEKNLKLGLKHLFESADATEDLKDKLSVYQEIVEYCEDAESSFVQEYLEEANAKIKEINDTLYELAIKGKETDKLKESVESVEKEKTTLTEQIEEVTQKYEAVKVKYEKAAQMLDDLKLREEKFKEMYDTALAEKNGMVKASEYNELYHYTEEKEEEIEELKEKIRELKKQVEESQKVDKPTKKIKKKKEEEVEEKVEDEVVEEQVEEEEEQNDDLLESATASVRDYYERMVDRYPNMKKIKEQILKCRTLMEAQRTYLSLKDLIEDSPSPYHKIPLIKEDDKGTEREKAYLSSGMKIREGWL